jgi:hypothetical protein
VNDEKRIPVEYVTAVAAGDWDDSPHLTGTVTHILEDDGQKEDEGQKALCGYEPRRGWHVHSESGRKCAPCRVRAVQRQNQRILALAARTARAVEVKRELEE